MDISEEALKYIDENPLAKEILLLLIKNPDTYFVHINWNGPQAGVIPSTEMVIDSRDFPNTYTGQRVEEAIKVLRDLENLGVLQNWIRGRSSSFTYCLAGEEFYDFSEDKGTPGANKTPEIREELSKLLV